MKLRVWQFTVLVGVVTAVATGLTGNAQAAGPKKHKVIITPADNESVDELTAKGIQKVRNYGAYWVVDASEEQVKALQKTHGTRAVKADHLNRIELSARSLDTSVAEPEIPSRLSEILPVGKRLRLVQFSGPVQTEWLELLKGAGKVKVLNYIPHNAYLVQLDAAAEEKLVALKEPAGPIQYVGPYHPLYKAPGSLLTATNATEDVRICVVGGDGAEMALQTLAPFALGGLKEKWTLRGQISVHATVRVADLPSIAQLPEVLWVRKIVPIKKMDETAGIVCATSEDLPPPTRYLEFLTNTVGFSTAPGDYPVLDICDSGLDMRSSVPGCPADPFHPAFYTAGSALSMANDLFNFTGVQSCLYGGGDRVVYNGTAGRLTDNDGHGTSVASTAVGFDDRDDEVLHCFTEAGNCQVIIDVPPPYPPSIYPNTVTRRDGQTGLQYGMGISPFGRIGASSMNAATADPIDLAWRVYMATARISNNSWGEVFDPGVNDGIYDALSLAYDFLTRDTLQTGSPNTPGPWPFNQEITYVFANGNANAINGTGYGDVLVTPPATAKNVISVGASSPEDPGDLLSFTSYGPTEDGRIKPEIVAVGSGMAALSQTDASYQNHNLHVPWYCGGFDPNDPAPGPCQDNFFTQRTIHTLYVPFGGTSMAAPQVSGAIQLLWWYFGNRLSMLQPTPAMSKAYVMNSARYLPIINPFSGVTDKLPSVAQGMGRLDLARMFDGVPRVLRDSSAPRAIDAPLMTTNIVTQQTFFTKPGQSYEVSGTVADATKPFRVTLVWSDEPGSPASFKQLVNDLDLQVTINGQTYLGNYFDREFSTADTFGFPDRTNNFECISLPAGQTGTWSVVVRAIDIPGTGVPNLGTAVNQDFALAVYNGRNPTDAGSLGTNDTAQTATRILTLPFAYTNTMTAARYHNNHPSPIAAQGGINQFYKITNPTIGTIFTADTIGSAYDTVLSVWKGEPGTLVEVISTNNNVGTTLQEQLSWTVTEKTTYYIIVDARRTATIPAKSVLHVKASAPAIAFSPDSVDFGAHYIGTTSDVVRVRFTNGTSSDVTINRVELTNTEDFEILSESCSESYIRPGGSCELLLDFHPQGSVGGQRTGEIWVYDNATGSPRLLPLVGTALPRTPLICTDTASLTFGLTGVGSTSVLQRVTVTNCGTTNLVFTAPPTFSGTGAGDFAVISNACLNVSLLPGDSCTMDVAFIPQTAGTRLAAMNFVSNAGGGVTAVSLKGTAEVPTAKACVTPNPVIFEDQTLGTTSTVHSVTITNCGTAVLHITGVSLTGTNSTQFLIDGNTCVGVAGGIPVGGTCTVELRFAPNAIGLVEGVLSIASNGAGNPHTVTLRGNGIGSQPDLWIGKTRKTKKMTGDDVYSTAGAASNPQNLALKTGRGKAKKTFYIACQNDGNIPDSFNVQGSPDVPGVYTVQYFLGSYPKESVDITDLVKEGTYSTAAIAPGAVTGDATMIRVVVTKEPTTTSSTNVVEVTATSAKNPTKSDTVKSTVTTR